MAWHLKGLIRGSGGLGFNDHTAVLILSINALWMVAINHNPTQVSSKCMEACPVEEGRTDAIQLVVILMAYVR